MKIKNKIKVILSPFRSNLEYLFLPLYKLTKKPFSLGYNLFKWKLIEKSINDPLVLNAFKDRIIPNSFGLKMDERVVEYPLLFANFSKKSKKILDAGSTFNFKEIIEHPYFSDKNLNIYTFYPESINFPSNRVSYQYGDLRSLPYEDCIFDQVISHSTIEHIDMDNSIYGYELEFNQNKKNKSYEYLKAISEMQRVLAKDGIILLTFPYGKFKNYGFFQQFDSEMVNKIIDYLSKYGKTQKDFIKYSEIGWQFALEESCLNSTSYNPHTGENKLNDGAAHSRCICFVKFQKF